MACMFFLHCWGMPCWLKKVSYEDWHARLGHPQLRTISQIINKYNLSCSSSKSNHVYPSCSMDKMSRLHLNSMNNIYRFHLNWSTKVCEVQHLKFLLLVIDILFYLSMILPGIFGYIVLKIKLTYVLFFFNFNHLLKDNSIPK